MFLLHVLYSIDTYIYMYTHVKQKNFLYSIEMNKALLSAVCNQKGLAFKMEQSKKKRIWENNAIQAVYLQMTTRLERYFKFHFVQQNP